MNENTPISNLQAVLNSGAFAVTAELGPPRSVDPDTILKKASYLKNNVDAVNVTDNQTAIVRVSSVATSALLVKNGFEPIMQMTCRDRNRLAIQADVLGASILGIRNILCLTGDHQIFGDHPNAKGVFDLDSTQLVSAISIMKSEGKFMSGEELKTTKKSPLMTPQVFIGAVENPFADPFEFRVTRLAKKITAGAQFIQTQCIYDMDRFAKWMIAIYEQGLTEKAYILAGLTPLKSARMAVYMRDSVAGVIVPDDLVKRMEQATDPKEEGLKICMEQIQQVKEIPGVAGVHIMAIEWEHMIPEIVSRANLLPRPAL